MRAEGVSLLNLTDGGEGLAGHKFSDEHKQRIAAAIRNRLDLLMRPVRRPLLGRQARLQRAGEICSRQCAIYTYNRGGHRTPRKGSHRGAELWLGDCRDILPTLGKVDAVITDPPYGLGIDGQKESVRRDGSQLRKHHEKLGWDKAIPDNGLMQSVLAAGSSTLFGRKLFLRRLAQQQGWLVWFKGQTGLTMSDGELAWTSLQIPLRVKNLHRTHLWQSLQSIRHRSPPS